MEILTLPGFASHLEDMPSLGRCAPIALAAQVAGLSASGVRRSPVSVEREFERPY